MRNGLQGEHLPQDPADPVTSSPQLWQPQSERPESQSLPVLQLPTYLPPQTWQHQQGKYHPPKSEPDFYEILGREETFGGALLSRQNVGAMNQGWTDDERRLMQDLLGCMLPSADDAALMRKVSVSVLPRL